MFVGLADGTIAHVSVNATEQQLRDALDASLAPEAPEQPHEPVQADACMALMCGHTEAVTCVCQSGDAQLLCSGAVLAPWNPPESSRIHTNAPCQGSNCVDQDSSEGVCVPLAMCLSCIRRTGARKHLR